MAAPRLPEHEKTRKRAVAGIRQTLERTRMNDFRPLTPMRLYRFLEAVRTGSEAPEAAEFAGARLGSLRDLRRSDPEFAAAWAEAEDESVDYLRSEAQRRAVEGWKEPVFHRGEVVGHIQRYSDRLLELLLKARAPEFADRKTITVQGTTSLTAADLERARALPTVVPVEVLEQIAMAMVEFSENPPADDVLELEAGAVRDD